MQTESPREPSPGLYKEYYNVTAMVITILPGERKGMCLDERGVTDPLGYRSRRTDLPETSRKAGG